MPSQKATRIDLFSFSTPQMRAFHLSWLAFFVCFFAWFAVAPLMPVIKGEFHLTPDQIANINIAAVGITIVVRLIVGPLCDRAHKAGLICAPSVGPGYNALRANGDTHIKSRDNGTTYDAMWKAAIQAGADRITITSYNEWHEGTQIEPAVVPPSRHLAAAPGPRTSPFTQAYLSYDGTYGLHGKQASTAYLARTAYWTGVYRNGHGSATPAMPARKAAAQGRKTADGLLDTRDCAP